MRSYRHYETNEREGDGVSERRKSVLFFSRVCFYCTGSLAFLVNIGMEVTA